MSRKSIMKIKVLFLKNEIFPTQIQNESVSARLLPRISAMKLPLVLFIFCLGFACKWISENLILDSESFDTIFQRFNQLPHVFRDDVDDAWCSENGKARWMNFPSFWGKGSFNWIVTLKISFFLLIYLLKNTFSERRWIKARRHEKKTRNVNIANTF